MHLDFDTVLAGLLHGEGVDFTGTVDEADSCTATRNGPVPGRMAPESSKKKVVTGSPVGMVVDVAVTGAVLVVTGGVVEVSGMVVVVVVGSAPLVHAERTSTQLVRITVERFIRVRRYRPAGRSHRNPASSFAGRLDRLRPGIWRE